METQNVDPEIARREAEMEFLGFFAKLIINNPGTIKGMCFNVLLDDPESPPMVSVYGDWQEADKLVPPLLNYIVRTRQLHYQAADEIAAALAPLPKSVEFLPAEAQPAPPEPSWGDSDDAGVPWMNDEGL